MNKLARTRERLWKKNPHCHWCGVLTIDYRDRKHHHYGNEATLDHMYSRYSPLRGKRTYVNVLACYKCNNQRCQKEQRELDRSVLWAKSDSIPVRELGINSLISVRNVLLRKIKRAKLQSLITIQSQIDRIIVLKMIAE